MGSKAPISYTTGLIHLKQPPKVTRKYHLLVLVELSCTFHFEYDLGGGKKKKQSITEHALQLSFKLGDDGYNRSHHPAGYLEGPRHPLAQNLASYPLQKRPDGHGHRISQRCGVKTLSLRIFLNILVKSSTIEPLSEKTTSARQIMDPNQPSGVR